MKKNKASKSKNKSNDKTKSKTKDKSKSITKSKNEDDEPQDDDVKEDDDVPKFHLLTKRFDGHVCVVTGAGHDNLGRAVGLRLAQEGAIVIILDNVQYNPSIEAIQKKCKSLSLRFLFVCL